MTPLMELARQVGVNERTLRRSVDVGTFRATRVSPRKLEVSLAEKAYIRKTWHDLTALRSALRTESNVRFALLFGSMARGEHGPGSDVDLLVEMADDSLDRRFDLGLKLGEAVNRRVEVMIVRTARNNSLLLESAVAEGRILVDRDQRWPSIVEDSESLSRTSRRNEAKRSREVLEGIDRFLAGRK